MGNLGIGSWILVLGTIAVLAVGVLLAIARARPSAAFPASAALAVWLVAAAGFTVADALRIGGLPVVLGLFIVVPIALGVLAMGWVPAVRSIALAVPQRWLVSLQMVRLIGFLFLWLCARGTLPATFAVPAGVGDVSVAIAAPFVASMVSRRRPGARGWLWAWNVAGVVDFAAAVTLGVLSSEGPLRLFFSGPPADALRMLPLSLIPSFAIPVVALLHAASILQLRREPAGPPGLAASQSRKGAPAFG